MLPAGMASLPMLWCLSPFVSNIRCMHRRFWGLSKPPLYSYSSFVNYGRLWRPFPKPKSVCYSSDPQCSAQNTKAECLRTKHCWQNYVDYHKCILAKGEDFPPCRQVRVPMLYPTYEVKVLTILLLVLLGISLLMSKCLDSKMGWSKRWLYGASFIIILNFNLLFRNGNISNSIGYVRAYS